MSQSTTDPPGPAFSGYGRRDAMRKLALAGLGGAAAAGYGALVLRGLMRADMAEQSTSGAGVARISHQLGWIKGVQFAGEFLAQHLGYLKDEGIDADFIAAGPATDYRTLVASRRMLVSESTPLGLIEGAVQGQPLVAFAAVMQRDPGAFLSPPHRPITSLQDMVGKTIGVPASIRKLTTVLLNRAHIPTDEIKFVPVGTDASMLAAGQIDGYYSHSTTAVPGLRALGMDPHVLYLSDLGVPGYAQAFIARRDTLEQHHEMFVRYTRALIKGWRYFVENPEASAELIVREWAPKGTSLSDQLAQAKLMQPFITGGEAKTKGLLWIDPAVFAGALDFARQSGTVPPGMSIDTSKLVTQSVIKQALVGA